MPPPAKTPSAPPSGSFGGSSKGTRSGGMRGGGGDPGPGATPSPAFQKKCTPQRITSAQILLMLKSQPKDSPLHELHAKAAAAPHGSLPVSAMAGLIDAAGLPIGLPSVEVGLAPSVVPPVATAKNSGKNSSRGGGSKSGKGGAAKTAPSAVRRDWLDGGSGAHDGNNAMAVDGAMPPPASRSTAGSGTRAANANKPPPKTGGAASEPDLDAGCNCKKSKCLKLYVFAFVVKTQPASQPAS